MNTLYLMDQLSYKDKTASDHIWRNGDESSDQRTPALLSMHWKRTPQKAIGDVNDTLQRGYCPDGDLLGQWRKSYHDIITTKTWCVIYTWSPTSQWYLPASPADACLHDKLQSCGGSTTNAWTPSTIQSTEFFCSASIKVELMASCQNVSSAVYWVQDIRLMLPSEVSHSSRKLTPWNQSVCLPYSPMVQWHSYTTGTPLVFPKPNPFCTAGLTSSGAFGSTTLLLPTSIHTLLTVILCTRVECPL